MSRWSPIGLLLVWSLLPLSCSRCGAPPAPVVAPPPPVPSAKETPATPTLEADAGVGLTPDAGSTDAGMDLTPDAGSGDGGQTSDGEPPPKKAEDGFRRTKPGQTIGSVWLEGGRLSTWLEREICAEESCPIDVVLYDASAELGRIPIGTGLTGTIEPCRDRKWCWDLHDPNTEEAVASWVNVSCSPFRWKTPNREGILCTVEVQEDTGDAFPAPNYTLVTMTEPPFKLVKAWSRTAADFKGIIGAWVREAGDGTDEAVFTERPLPEEGEEVSITSVTILNANADGTALAENKPRFAIDVSTMRSSCKWLHGNPDVLPVNGARFPPLDARETVAMLALRRPQAEAWKKQIDACGKPATIVELK